MSDYPHISLEQWRGLLAVIEAGGYAQAAKALHKSQSAITYAVQKIESQLQIKVFEIQGRKAVLTEPAKFSTDARARSSRKRCCSSAAPPQCHRTGPPRFASQPTRCFRPGCCLSVSKRLRKCVRKRASVVRNRARRHRGSAC